MRTLLMAFLLIGCSGLSLAEEKVEAFPLGGTVTVDNRLLLTWSHPTMREDGSVLDVGEIAYTKVTWTCNGKTGSTKVLAPANSVTVGLPEPGECTYILNTGDTSGNESGDSIPYTFGVDPVAPSPPVPPSWSTDTSS